MTRSANKKGCLRKDTRIITTLLQVLRKKVGNLLKEKAFDLEEMNSLNSELEQMKETNEGLLVQIKELEVS